ncbi:SEC-C domain-containing protein [Candidatus Neptunochlamydia vexilliferae]|uniref:Uncharacterized protein n=1 Tax=Candidatus Neptunichlamydia vexilliferae TaxID=1651774 RepID=A0ABS0B0X0_9BACT|nr:SEC-C domain-containing protein [Candidatus Neptunochlamydia vexilliferae]MBF5060043.1 hypothetical protein [Candidatus Neptunochlamydia vexilliferae]
MLSNGEFVNGVSNEKVELAKNLLEVFSKEVRGMALYPPKGALCLCGSGKKYKKCCLSEEKRPFKHLEKGVKVVPDKELFFLENQKDCFNLSLCAEALNKEKKPFPIEELLYLYEKYPDHPAVQVVLAVWYKVNEERQSLEKVFQNFKECDALSVKLFRWWHIFESGYTKELPSIGVPDNLQNIEPNRKSFYLTEFALWGLIQICRALDKKRFIEAESHFLSLIKVTQKVGGGKHWAINEAKAILESGYFLRRMEILEMTRRN